MRTHTGPLKRFVDMASSPSGERSLLLDVVAFSAAIVAASVFRWEATDIIWGLWVSSLSVGFTTIVVGIASRAKDPSSGPLTERLAGGLGILAFFTFHFGLFHLAHSVFLSTFFPITDDDSFLSIFSTWFVALRLYWPFVLMTLLPKLPGLKRQWRGPDSVDASFAQPYANVVKMHLLIFVFAGLNAAGLSRYAVYPVLAFYFFPWRRFMKAYRAWGA
ncbi:hypothetical protein KAW64_00695 [bacterium]|nr:hypothetical protein [bacterium]